MKKILALVPFLLLLWPFAASAAIAAPFSASSTDRGFISPNAINGGFPSILIGATSTAATNIIKLNGLSTSTITNGLNITGGGLNVGALSGILKAVAGSIQTALVNLSSDVTGTLPVGNGGTGVGTFTTGLLGGSGTNNLFTQATTTLAGTGPVSVSNSPVVIGGSGAVISCATATGSVPGCLSATDWTTFNSKGSGSVTSIATNNGITGGTITTTGTIGLAAIGANSVLANNTSASAVPTALATSSLGIALSDTTGTLAIARGGTNATSQTTNGVNFFDGTKITSGSNVSYDGTTFQVSGSGLNNTLKVIGSNTTSAGLYFQDTAASAQTVFYVDNDRGSFASYGGLLNGGSTNAIGNIFGLSRADHVFLFADGANTTGLSIGTLTAQPLTFGTANAEVGRFSSNGFLGIGSTTPGTLLSIGSSTTFINLNNVGTSTFAKGINILAGCFSVNGTCITGGTGSSPAGASSSIQYNGNGSFAGNTGFTYDGSDVGIGTTTPQKLLHVYGNQSGGIVRFERRTAGVSGTSGSPSLFGTSDVAFSDTGTGHDFLGPTQTYSFINSAGTVSSLGQVGAIRTGADDTGNLDIVANSAGVSNNIFTVAGNGVTAVGSTSPSNAAASCGAFGFCVVNQAFGGPTASEAQIKLVSGTSTDEIRTFITARSNVTPHRSEIGAETNNAFGLFTNNLARFFISAAGGFSFGSTYFATDPGANNAIFEGKIGIGTTSPYASLSINDVAGVDPFVIGSTTVGNADPYFGVDQFGTTTVRTLRFSDTGGNGLRWTVNENASNNIQFTYPSARRGLVIATGANQDSGFLDIGSTTNPGFSSFEIASATPIINFNDNDAGAGNKNLLISAQDGLFKIGSTSDDYSSQNYYFTVDGTKGGLIGIGTTTPYGTLSINAAAQTNPYFVIGSSTSQVFSISPAGSAQLAVATGTPLGTNALTVNGNIYLHGLATGAGNGSLCATTDGSILYDAGANCIVSSLRFKTDIASITPSTALTTVLKLSPITFKYKQGYGDNGVATWEGFGAEEVNLVDKNLVQYDAGGKPYSVYYQNITAKLVGAVQAIVTRLNTQQAEIDALKAQNRAMQHEIDMLKK